MKKMLVILLLFLQTITYGISETQSGAGDELGVKAELAFLRNATILLASKIKLIRIYFHAIDPKEPLNTFQKFDELLQRVGGQEPRTESTSRMSRAERTEHFRIFTDHVLGLYAVQVSQPERPAIESLPRGREIRIFETLTGAPIKIGEKHPERVTDPARKRARGRSPAKKAKK
ncbi:MAG: hypothetical protein ABIA04_13170 [Pseudomonadota bacterium]